VSCPTFIRKFLPRNNAFTVIGQAEQTFTVFVFKFDRPEITKSMISLVAHNEKFRTSITHIYTEFLDEFYEKDASGDQTSIVTTSLRLTF